MDVHKNAPLTPKGREVMLRSVIDGGRAYLAVNLSAARVAGAGALALSGMVRATAKRQD